MENENASAQLRESLRVLVRKLGLLEENEFSCCNITLAQCHALVEIGRAGTISLNQLADLMNLENSTMSKTVTNLVNSNLVKRDIDPADRRYLTISLTDNGKALFGRIENSMTGYYNEILEKIPFEKRNQILESLQLLIDAIADKESACKC
jgi:DNA-binding MarR family transcriptional regulator